MDQKKATFEIVAFSWYVRRMYHIFYNNMPIILIIRITRGTMYTKHQLRKGYSTMIISNNNHKNYSDNTEVTLRVVVSYIVYNNMSIIIISTIRVEKGTVQ
jgi:hypothetical protein